MDINGIAIEKTDITPIIKYRLLFTEDSPTIQLLLSEHFYFYNKDVIKNAKEKHMVPEIIDIDIAKNIAETEKYLSNKCYDCHFLDLGLPDSNRDATIEWLKDRTTKIKDEGLFLPLVALTGSDDELTKQQVLNAGATMFQSNVNLSKIINDLDNFITTVRNLYRVKFRSSIG